MTSLFKRIFGKSNKYHKFNDKPNLDTNMNNQYCPSSLPTNTNYHMCDQNSKKKYKTQNWAAAPIKHDLPYFGSFLTLILPAPNIPHRLLVYVDKPSIDLEKIPSFPSIDDGQLRYLTMSFEDWPFVNPCPKCENKLTHNQIYDGFYMEANAIAYHYNNLENSYYHHTTTDITKTVNSVSTKHIFLYYVPDETKFGSLYWHENNLLYNSRIPLDCISDIYVGSTSPFFNEAKNFNFIIKNLDDCCLSLKTKDGFMLNINLISPIQKSIWVNNLINIPSFKNRVMIV